MNRRSFLKAVGVIGASTILVPSFDLVLPESVIAEDLTWFATVREVCAYDINSDSVLVQHDVLSPFDNIQLGITQRVRNRLDANETKEIRRIAADELLKGIKIRGILLSNLRPLPIPTGFSSLELAA